jgi:pimeloyl-ACP methyl ester carboxylesterase
VGQTQAQTTARRVLVAVVVLVAGACTWGSGGARPKIAWYSCSEAMPIATAQCGYMRVPLDYARPNGATTLLAVSRVRHTVPDAQYQGVMLVNPGGPGGSGLVLSGLGRLVADHAGDAYDWIGFDPRGVGSSAPALSCLGDYHGPNRPDYVPTTPAIEQAWLDRSKEYAQACRENGGDLLDHMSTVDTARDMESIRTALGAPAINFYGFSYGTYLGQVYATMFPQRVRRMVLDSNVDPRHVWYQSNFDQDIAFERTMKAWFAWLARYDGVYHLGATGEAVEQRWRAEQDALRSAPANGTVGPSEWTDIFMPAGYYQSLWPGLGEAFANWVRTHDPNPIVSRYIDADSPGDDRQFAAYQAVQCSDAPWPTNWDQWKQDNWRTYESAPLITWANAWFNSPCLFWTAKARQPVAVDGRQVPGILLVDETLDAATPFEGSLEVRRRFPRASLLAEPGGTTHAGSLHGNACVDGQVAAYLATGKLPPRTAGDGADTTCAPLPEPVPTPPAAGAVSAQADKPAATALFGRLPRYR